MNIHVTFLTNAFLICLDFASRVLVPCPDYVHHILVVYAGMVDNFYFFGVFDGNLHCSFYVPQHGEVEFSSFVLPIKCESNIYFSFPGLQYLIVFY